MSSTTVVQVGESESLESAMNAFAPEFNAVFIILRSRGPVISTRRPGLSPPSPAEARKYAATWLSPFRAAIAADASEQKQNRVTAG